MPNKLKEVFSDKMVEMGLELSFRDNEAHDKFLESIKTVYDEGRTVEIDGVSVISTSMQEGDMVYPSILENSPKHVIIAPSVEPVAITVDTARGKKKANFRRYETSNEIIIESNSNEIVFLKFAFKRGSHIVQFTYRIQSQFANKTKDVVESYCVAIGFLTRLFKIDNERNVSDDSESLRMIMQAFRTMYSFWGKLSSIENELALSFDPMKIGNMDDIILDVEELYLLLVEKIAVRVDRKLTPTESSRIVLESSEYIPEIGQPIDLIFVGENTYLICEQTIVVYTANLICNVIIKEVTSTETGATKILYGDTDSKPMYISSTGHETLEEAKAESSLIIEDKERTAKYKEALTVTEYYKKETSRWL